MLAQYKKELRGHFCNMTGVVYIALVLIITGIFATIMNFKSGSPEFEQTLNSAAFIFFLAVPILTMRSFAEEKSSRTDQLLYALPIGMTRVVVGKYLAMLTVHAASTIILCIYPILLSLFGSVNFVCSYSGIFAFFLLGCALIAIGMFISTLTSSQLISAVITFGVFVAVYLMSLIASLIPTGAAASLTCFFALAVILGFIVYGLLHSDVAGLAAAALVAIPSVLVYFFDSSLFENLVPTIIEKFALFDRLDIFIYYGIFDISAVVYYVSIVLLFVYLSVRSMDKRRWS